MKKLLPLGCLLLSAFLFDSAFAAKSDTGEKIDLTDIEARLAELEALVASNQQSIATANGAISQNASDIATANGAISQNVADIAVLFAAANETLEDKVSGRAYSVKTTGGGIGTNMPVFDYVTGWFTSALEQPTLDWAVGEGALQLHEDGSYTYDLTINVINAKIRNEVNVIGEGGSFPIEGSFVEYKTWIPVDSQEVGTWAVDESTSEVLLSNGEILQASPSGETLHLMGNDQRLIDAPYDDPDQPYWHSYINDAVYIQLPDSP